MKYKSLTLLIIPSFWLAGCTRVPSSAENNVQAEASPTVSVTPHIVTNRVRVYAKDGQPIATWVTTNRADYFSLSQGFIRLHDDSGLEFTACGEGIIITIDKP